MRFNSFSIFLNIILAMLLFGSVVFSYFFGNFGGISLKDLNGEYLLKKELRFSDLPKELQKKYINRDNFKSQTGTIKVKKVFDDEGNPLVEGIENFKDVIDSLQHRVTFLEKENMVLSTDKSELLKIVEYEKSKNNIEQKSLFSSNLENINEAEQQHYKNISELTQKINDLHRENINLSQQLNKKEESFKDRIEEMKKQIDKEKETLNDKEKELNSKYQEKVALVNGIGESQKKQIVELESKLKSQYSSSVLDLGKKDQKISLLQHKINEMMLEKNSILTKNSEEAMKLERKHSEKLQEFNEIVKNSTHEKDLIKQEYEKTLQRVEDKYIDLLKIKTDDITMLKQKLAYEKQNSITILSNSEKTIAEKEQILDTKVKIIKEQNSAKVKVLSNKIANLEKEMKTLDDSKKRALEKLKSKETKITLYDDKILQLQDKVKTLEHNDRIVDDEVNKLVLKNEKKHNKNYKILNEKIALLELNTQTMQKKNKKTLSTLADEKGELISKLNSAREKSRQKDAQIQKIKSSMKVVEQKKSELELSEQEKLVSLRKSFDDLKSTVSLKEQSYETLITKLKLELADKKKEFKVVERNRNKLRKYIREITSLKKTIKDIQSGKKLVKLKQLGKVECGDMVSGNFKISSTCKSKVDKFLSKYDKTYYFEVIPIVGTGGFASLNKVKRDKRIGIADSEIKRLTRLSNIGLGRDRAKEGGWLIREKFGDDVKISYTIYSIEAKDKRGFVIRAYR